MPFDNLKEHRGQCHRRVKRIYYGALLLPVFLCCSTRSFESGTDLPLAVRQAGFTSLTYSVRRLDSKTADVEASFRPGFLLYNPNFFGKLQSPAFTRYNRDGTATTFTDSFASLSTAACQTMACTGFVGTAFGGGAFIEAEIAYDAKRVRASDLSVPAFWAISLESVLNVDHWDGWVAGYNHTAEVDILEQNQGEYDAYGATVHDQFGRYNLDCPIYCRVSSSNTRIAFPAGTDTERFHRVSALWLPAGPSHNGSVQFFYDHKPVGHPVFWSWFERSSTPPPSRVTPWTFGILDQLHLIAMVSSSVSVPISIKSMQVWQLSGAQNLHH